MKSLARGLIAASMLVFGSVYAEDADVSPDLLGHSNHGSSFDVGPRQMPWKMDDIGSSHFPITSSHPEVQQWFDQGHTLLHGFWAHEAERAFRWCLKLDPDCAMAYWGMARCIQFRGQERRVDFLKEAVARRDSVSHREQMYIDAWAKAYIPEYSGELVSEEEESVSPDDILAKELELIVLEYPEDVEARALLVLANLASKERLGNEAIIRDILEEDPDHPGAHHYRVHVWDGKEGRMALESCERYGRIASQSGHANHMPGHVYSGIGMWHEGAIWMDRATRVEKRYMESRMTLPFHNWNYSHNRDYLSFIQEQLGMPSLSIDGARQLLKAPLDPDYNPACGFYTIRRQGMEALVRGLVKFERWDEILEEGSIPWTDCSDDDLLRTYAETLAHLGNGDLEEAIEGQIELRNLTLVAPADSAGWGTAMLEGKRTRMQNEVDARIAAETGDILGAMKLLAEAAESQYLTYRERNDPPHYPVILFTALGEMHLEAGAPSLAVLAFEKTLEICPNDAFAISGLARAHAALGNLEEANHAYGRMKFLWSSAEPGLRWIEDLEGLGLESDPIDESPKEQRSYRTETLENFGPEQWRPYAAPTLDAIDSDGERVTLDEYKGEYVLLVFYLGEGCPHCVDQLKAIEAKSSEFESRGVSLVAISSDSQEDLANSKMLGELPFRMLSDKNSENARRYKAYDDFEEIELHSTLIIDKEGRIHWSRTEGEPFMDIGFLVSEIDRIKEMDEADAAAKAPVETVMN